MSPISKIFKNIHMLKTKKMNCSQFQTPFPASLSAKSRHFSSTPPPASSTGHGSPCLQKYHIYIYKSFKTYTIFQRCCNIFFPLRFRTSSSFKTAGVLCSILIFSMSIQLWTPIFITEKRLDNHMDYIYCGEDPRYSR